MLTVILFILWLLGSVCVCARVICLVLFILFYSLVFGFFDVRHERKSDPLVELQRATLLHAKFLLDRHGGGGWSQLSLGSSRAPNGCFQKLGASFW